MSTQIIEEQALISVLRGFGLIIEEGETGGYRSAVGCFLSNEGLIISDKTRGVFRQIVQGEEPSTRIFFINSPLAEVEIDQNGVVVNFKEIKWLDSITNRKDFSILNHASFSKNDFVRIFQQLVTIDAL